LPSGPVIAATARSISKKGDAVVTRRHQFIPASIDVLESRLALSHVAPGGGAGLDARSIVSVRQSSMITAEINQDFNLFENDYDQARSTYFTSIQNQTNPTEATTYAFVAYTTQRVSLLAQQLLSISSQFKLGPARTRGLKQVVATKIIGPRAQMLPGSLGQSLLATIPQPGTSAPTASLYTLSQNNAIAAAQVAILNGVAKH
jgi:hypothetical protein